VPAGGRVPDPCDYLDLLGSLFAGARNSLADIREALHVVVEGSSETSRGLTFATSVTTSTSFVLSFPLRDMLSSSHMFPIQQTFAKAWPGPPHFESSATTPFEEVNHNRVIASLHVAFRRSSPHTVQAIIVDN
jgi:hypothetical protein